MHFCIQSSGSDLQRRDAARLGAKLGQGSLVPGSIQSLASHRPLRHSTANWRAGFSSVRRVARSGAVGAVGAFWAALGLQLPYHPQGYLGDPLRSPRALMDWIGSGTIKRCWNWTGVANGMDGPRVQSSVLRVFFAFHALIRIADKNTRVET